MTTTFENARESDRLFDDQKLAIDQKKQNCTVVQPPDGDGSLRIRPDDGGTDMWIPVSGMFGNRRRWFWSAPQVIAPEQPKRMRKVKRSIDVCISRSFFKSGEFYSATIYGEKKGREGLIPATLSYEDEEE